VPSDRVNGGYTTVAGTSSAYGTGPAPGVGVSIGGVGASLSGSQDAGGTVQVQLTGVIALILLAIVVYAAHKLM
jgi:hypothetical protein